MAYIAGIVSSEEKAELERRGWEFEDAPKELISGEMHDDDDDEFVMVWVDNSVFDVMNGPDWEKARVK